MIGMAPCAIQRVKNAIGGAEWCNRDRSVLIETWLGWCMSPSPAFRARKPQQAHLDGLARCRIEVRNHLARSGGFFRIASYLVDLVEYARGRF